MIAINVATDFTRFPSGRYARNGSTSGEGFRKKCLEEPLLRGEQVVVDLDGTVGYGSSFLEEAFGGLVRSLRLSSEVVLHRVALKSADPSLEDEIRQYILDAGKAQAKASAI